MRKKAFVFNSTEFSGMDEKARISKIHEHPYCYKKELIKRQEIIKKTLNSNFDSMARTSTEAVRVSNTGSHSDITADTALRELEYETLCSKEIKFNDLGLIDTEKSPAIKCISTLMKSIFLYERVIELFPDDISNVLVLRMNGHTLIDIAEKIDRSESYVTKKITRSYIELQDKISEMMEIWDYSNR